MASQPHRRACLSLPVSYNTSPRKGTYQHSTKSHLPSLGLSSDVAPHFQTIVHPNFILPFLSFFHLPASFPAPSFSSEHPSLSLEAPSGAITRRQDKCHRSCSPSFSGQILDWIGSVSRLRVYLSPKHHDTKTDNTLS